MYCSKKKSELPIIRRPASKCTGVQSPSVSTMRPEASFFGVTNISTKNKNINQKVLIRRKEAHF